MAFVLRRSVHVLPFLRLNKTKNTRGGGRSGGQGRRASWTWHLGFWSYSTRTGRHTFRLSRSLAWESRPRGRGAAVRVAAARARHPRWTPEQIAENTDVSVRRVRRCIRKADNRARRQQERATWDAAWQRYLYGDGTSPTPPAPAATRGSRRTAAATPAGSYAPGGRARVQPRDAGHVAGMQAAGLCGAITTTGARCRNKGDCPHHGTAARAAAGSAGTP
jgi:hypothetical protein